MADTINELKIINDTISEQKMFKSIDEFNLFYQKNAEKMKTQTTNYLNKIYKIITSDGTEYKITKRNSDGKRVGGDIYLKKLGNTITKSLENDVINASIEELREQIHQLQDKNKILEEHVNNLFHHISLPLVGNLFLSALSASSTAIYRSDSCVAHHALLSIH